MSFKYKLVMSLAEDCDFSVWQMPDDTLGRDFVKFLRDIAKKEGDE